jgi:hypothetical protein
MLAPASAQVAIAAALAAPIRGSVGGEDRGAEPGDQLGERRLAGLDDLARELIGVDHGRAAGDERLRHGGLSRGDPAGQSDHVNGHEALYHSRAKPG